MPLFLEFGMSGIRASLHLARGVLGAAAQELGCCKAGRDAAFGCSLPCAPGWSLNVPSALEQPGHGSSSVQPFPACRQGGREGLCSSSSSSSSCFLFSPLFLLLVIPCVIIPHLALYFAFLLQVVCLLLGWICVRLQYEVFSYRTYCFYAKHLNCELKFTYQLKTKDVAILTMESQEKMKSCIFLTFLVKIFSHIYLKLAF